MYAPVDVVRAAEAGRRRVGGDSSSGCSVQPLTTGTYRVLDQDEWLAVFLMSSKQQAASSSNSRQQQVSATAAVQHSRRRRRRRRSRRRGLGFWGWSSSSSSRQALSNVPFWTFLYISLSRV
jgi:hypothetical protein